MDRVIQTAGEYSQTGNARPRYNRTGATSVKGGVGFIDYTRTDAASTDRFTAEQNVVAVTTALIATRPRLAVWKDAGVADDARGQAFVGEDIVCPVLVNSTTDISVGDWLIPVDGGDHLVKATRFSVDETGAAAAESLVPVYAQALEARTANDEGTILCRLFSDGKIF